MRRNASRLATVPDSLTARQIGVDTHRASQISIAAMTSTAMMISIGNLALRLLVNISGSLAQIPRLLPSKNWSEFDTPSVL